MTGSCVSRMRALLAIVPSPIRVVVVVAGQVVNLLRGVALQALLDRGSPDGKVEGVLAVEAFFGREEIAVAGVGAAVNVVQCAAEACGGASGDRPAVLQQTGGVGEHQTVVVTSI